MKAIKNKTVIISVAFAFLLNPLCFAQELLPGNINPNVQPKELAPPEPFKEMISVDYKDVDIADILRSLSYTYGLNLVTSTEVKGKITISLKDVSLSEALEAILSANGYNYSRKGNILYITPGAAEGAQVVTEPITLKYLKAVDAQNLVRKVLSPKGDIKVDEISNMLVVTDYAASIEKLKELLKNVDLPPRQVLIEAKIVDITSKDFKNLGVTWQVDYSPGHGIFDRNTKSSERLKATTTIAGPSSSVSGSQFKLDTFVLKGLTATATIDALVQAQKAHLLASPSIAVLNNREARIIIGEKVPYKERTQTTTGTTETTRYIDVGTTLRVTPSINADGYITLDIHPEVSSVNALLDAGPRITTREADTVVRVKEGETIVIGGLIKQVDDQTRSRVPILGYIPILGLLFSNKSSDKTQTELAVFITPKILLSRAEMLAENKTHYEEEAYVSIMNTAGLNVQMKLFEKARRLQLGGSLEARDKEDWQRKNQALSLYESIFTQFPDGPKAPEAGYQAAVLYNELNELYLAKQMCANIVSRYPDSPFALKARDLQKVINERVRREAREKVETELTKIKALAKEEQYQKVQQEEDEILKARLQEALEKDKKEATKKARLQEEKLRRAKEKQEAKVRLEESRQRAEIEKEMIKARQKEEAGKKAEEAARLKAEEARKKAAELARQREEIRKKADAEAAEKARLKAEEARKKAEEIARQKEEAPKKAAELARQREEIRKKGEEKIRLAKEAQLKAAKEAARQKEEARKQANEKAILEKEVRKKAAEETKRQNEQLRKKATAEVAENARLREEAHKKAAEKAAAKREEAGKKAEEAARQKEAARKQAKVKDSLEKELRKKAAAEATEKVRLEAEEKARLREEARQKAEDAAQRARLEKEARKKTEEKKRLEQKAREKIEEAERLKEEAQKKSIEAEIYDAILKQKEMQQ